jgi:intein/homing endonuclease
MFSLTEELMYIIGVYFSDGCVTIYERKDGKGKNYLFRVSSIDDDFIQEIKRCLSIILPERTSRIYERNRCDKRFKKCKLQKELHFTDKNLCEFLTSTTFKKTIIPDFIKESERELRLSFLAGFMDGDGWIQKSKRSDSLYGGQIQIGFCGSYDFVDEIAKMFQRIGVKLGKRQLIPIDQNSVIVRTKSGIRYMLKTESFLKAGCYFKIERKQSRLRDYNVTLKRKEEMFNKVSWLKGYLDKNPDKSFRQIEKETGINREVVRFWKKKEFKVKG